METFYDGDLKDIWDSDLDPTESLKISSDTDMHDWFLERDIKDPAVILNDKLISDALLNGTLPIKSEHSYSLNSDGDSLPDSPRSLQTKMDDMEDECYPAISLKTATSNTRTDTAATIDPKCLSISAHTMSNGCTPMAVSSFGSSTTMLSSSSTALSAIAAQAHTAIPAAALSNGNGNSYAQTHILQGFHKNGSTALTVNIRNPANGNCGSHKNLRHPPPEASTNTVTFATTLPQQCVQHPEQYLTLPTPQELSSMANNDGCCSPASSREGSTSPDICSDIEIDESCIKDEPMSPDSSCPPSPTNSAPIQKGSLSLNMANMAAFTNSDLVFEHKNGCLQLTSASQNLLKSQQLILGANTSNAPSIILPKFNIKTEIKSSGNTFATGTSIKTNTRVPYGLPLTPPSSHPSDDSEGNATPEHLVSPLSPNTSVSLMGASTSNGTPITMSASSNRRSTSSSSSSSSSSNCLTAASRNIGGGSTRQPIHTPLISTQPKGSTGTLILTEEEKRTLLAEGYPIPQKLPLSKAEEKSLKKIRRKIKNKISAQESRRKKKEYMDQLERRVDILVNENSDYRKRVESLEDSNANLLSQLHKLQALVNKPNGKKF